MTINHILIHHLYIQSKQAKVDKLSVTNGFVSSLSLNICNNCDFYLQMMHPLALHVQVSLCEAHHHQTLHQHYRLYQRRF